MSQNMIWPIDNFLKSPEKTRQKVVSFFTASWLETLVGIFLVPISLPHNRGKFLCYFSVWHSSVLTFFYGIKITNDFISILQLVPGIVPNNDIMYLGI